MEFVWMPALKMWVGKYEVTNGEYRKNKPLHNSGSFQGLSLNGDRQPVAMVNFDDAKSYAEWLTEKERQAGRLPADYRYRLPSEQEWLTFAQCGDGREYPWGNNWPPQSGQAGNYADMTAKQAYNSSVIINGYTDGHAVSCDVEQSWGNPWGLYGVGGNVWEATASGENNASFGAWLGACWNDAPQVFLRCSGFSGPRHDTGIALGRGICWGFRLVLAPVSP
jgi:formylglycine-generating enzyme required for sulfatase activity